jgi:hypothetical protein
MTDQVYSNGSVHNSGAAMNSSSKNDAYPSSPTTPDTPSHAAISPVSSPPYWTQSHRRSVSTISVESTPPGGIKLLDNTDGRDNKNEFCWAKAVHIDDHVVINGNRTGIGAFVVWNITVETLNVSNPRHSSSFNQPLIDCIISRVHPSVYENDIPSLTA